MLGCHWCSVEDTPLGEGLGFQVSLWPSAASAPGPHLPPSPCATELLDFLSWARGRPPITWMLPASGSASYPWASRQPQHPGPSDLSLV